MAKFHGQVGFAIPMEVKPDIWKDFVTEKPYSGDLLRNINRSVESNTTVNDSIVLNNQISILADPFINQHFPSIRYLVWKGNRWKVTSVEDKFPRIILTIGGVYDGPTPKAEPDDTYHCE